ncbi:hypothetical protein HYFRA_00005514 [Hymenoscyphus fraxineus]|uniref:Uncharacterized protein n=1 Tax=Hymenoscyphus fraxineus TaxID=746836 RepID=A0A9N9KQP0_9HELO|nr:hypothetical protein HYFRA_00005514 [Hymenoscyphus fraxineus]
MDCLSHLQHCTHISTESLKRYLSQPSSTTSDHDRTTQFQNRRKNSRKSLRRRRPNHHHAGVENHHLALQTCWTLMTLHKPKTFRRGVSDSTICQPSLSQRHRSSNCQVRSLSSKTLRNKDTNDNMVRPGSGTRSLDCLAKFSAQRESREETHSLLWSENEMESNQMTHATSHSTSNPILLEMHGDQSIADSPIPHGILGARSPDAGGEEGMMGGGIVAPSSMYGTGPEGASKPLVFPVLLLLLMDRVYMVEGVLMRGMIDGGCPNPCMVPLPRALLNPSFLNADGREIHGGSDGRIVDGALQRVTTLR